MTIYTARDITLVTSCNFTGTSVGHVSVKYMYFACYLLLEFPGLSYAHLSEK